MNGELIKELKHVKKCIVAREARGADWEDQQDAVKHLEAVVTYLNDLRGRGIDLGE